MVTTYTFDAANRLTDQVRSDDRAYTYTWSSRGQMLSEWTEGAAVREFSYDAAGRMIEATVFTLTTRFTYNGLGARVAVEVVGQETTTFALDYAAGNRILAEATLAGAVHYLYGRDCLGELRDDQWLYYLNDATGYVRQGVDDQEQVVSGWLFDPDGVVLEGPEGPVSHLVCGGVYDWSTGLIYKGGRYFDPMLGIWLALTPLVVVQSWRERKKKRRGFPWYVMMLLVVCVSGVLTACCGVPEPPPSPSPPPRCITVEEYVTNLVQEFEQLEIDLKGLDWTGISGEKQIQNTQDLTNIVNTSPKMFDLDVGLGKLGKSEGNTIRLYETFPYASLELALPVVAHEAYQIYVGEDYYIQNIVDVERISWLIQTEVWEYARPVTQDYPSSSWFCTNCITPAPPLNEYDEEQIIAFNQNAWDTLQEGCMIKYRGLEKQREWIRDRGYGQ